MAVKTASRSESVRLRSSLRMYRTANDAEASVFPPQRTTTREVPMVVKVKVVRCPSEESNASSFTHHAQDEDPPFARNVVRRCGSTTAK